MSEQTAIRWEQDADNIVTLILDDPNQSANTMNELYGKSMAATVERLEKRKTTLPVSSSLPPRKPSLPVVICVTCSRRKRKTARFSWITLPRSSVSCACWKPWASRLWRR